MKNETFSTPQQWLDSERKVIDIRTAVIAKIREMSINPKTTEPLVNWISSQPCEPANSVCGFDLPQDELKMKALVKAVAGAWVSAGRP